MRMYLQPQLSTVSRKPVILFNHNPFAGYKRSAQNHKLRVNVWEIERLGLDSWQMQQVICLSWLFGVNGEEYCCGNHKGRLGESNVQKPRSYTGYSKGLMAGGNG